MNGGPPVTQPTRRFRWWTAVAAERWPLLLGLLSSAALLFLTDVNPFPVRHLAAELRMLLIVYPLAAWAVAVHVQRRTPHLTRLALRWYGLAFGLRVVMLCVLTIQAAGSRPYEGHVAPDSALYSVNARIPSLMLRGESYGAENMYLGDVSASGQLYGLAAPVGAWFLDVADRAYFVSHGLVVGVLVLFTGYSTVAVTLPYVAIGTFFVFQVLAMVSRFIAQDTGRRVWLWVMLMPDCLFFSAYMGKDMGVAVAFLWLVDLLDIKLKDRGVGWFLSVLALLYGWMERFRFQLIKVFLGLLGYDFVRRALPARLRGWWDGFTAAAVFLVLGSYKGDMGGQTFGGFEKTHVPTWADVVPSALLIPGPSLNFSPRVLFPDLTYLPVGLVWPFVAALLIVGVVQVYRGRLKFPPKLLVLIWVSLLLSSVVYPGSYGALRFRLMGLALILAFACEAWRSWRRDPPRSRLALGVLAMVVLLGVLLFHAAMIVRYTLA